MRCLTLSLFHPILRSPARPSAPTTKTPLRAIGQLTACAARSPAIASFAAKALPTLPAKSPQANRSRSPAPPAIHAVANRPFPLAVVITPAAAMSSKPPARFSSPSVEATISVRAVRLSPAMRASCKRPGTASMRAPAHSPRTSCSSPPTMTARGLTAHSLRVSSSRRHNGAAAATSTMTSAMRWSARSAAPR